MLNTQQKNKSTSSAPTSANTDFMQDSLNAKTLDDDHLKTSENTKPVPVTTSLPGAKNADTGLAVADHSAIENRSKRNKKDVAFQTMDADHSLGFTFQGTDTHAERSKARSKYIKGENAKEGETKDAGEGYRVHVGKAGEKSNTKDEALRKTTGVKNVSDYQKMLKKDFNFGRVVTQFAGKTTGKAAFDAGKDKFLAAVVERFYPGMKVGSPETLVAESIAINIWSYACKGQDVNGGTDIGELQGLLYVFDNQIKKSSDSNTKMSKGEKNTFIVPGTEGTDHEIKLQKGDERHGRATILTTRHLLADMTQEPPDSGLGGFDESYMLFDKSSSMQKDEFKKLGQMMNRGGINGSVSLAGFDGSDATLAKVQDGAPLTPTEAGQVLNTASTEASNKALPVTTPELSSGSGEIMNEQGMANALKWAKSLPKSSAKKRQMIVVTDEPDFNPAVLPELQKIARDKNLTIQVLYSFNSKTAEESYGGTADSYVLVDLLQIKSADDFIVDRLDATKRKENGSVDGANKTMTQQLDWGKAATAQGAKVRKW